MLVDMEMVGKLMLGKCSLDSGVVHSLVQVFLQRRENIPYLRLGTIQFVVV